MEVDNKIPEVLKYADGFCDEDLNPLPRAVIRPGAAILLDGDWLFSFDNINCGLTDAWYNGHEYTKTAHWPGNVEAYMAANNPTEQWQSNVVAWYERTFPLPEQSEPLKKTHNMLQLTFGACGYKTQVWLNGHLLSTIEGEAEHIGEYTSFSYELHDDLLQPVNRLTVRIAADKNADITRGKQESYVYKRGGIW